LDRNNNEHQLSNDGDQLSQLDSLNNKMNGLLNFHIKQEDNVELKKIFENNLKNYSRDIHNEV